MDATMGDPEVDRMPMFVLDGRPLTDRMWIYRCRSVLHHLVHAGREGQLEDLPGLADELRRRLDQRPER